MGCMCVLYLPEATPSCKVHATLGTLHPPSLVVLHGCGLGLARRCRAHGRRHCQGRQVMLVSFPRSLWAFQTVARPQQLPSCVLSPINSSLAGLHQAA